MGLTLRLLRHGATDWSDAGRYCGLRDIDLNPDGRQAAAVLAIDHDEFDLVQTSDLRRCVETASLAGLDAVPTSALREFDFGEIEGRTWDELDAAMQDRLVAFDDFVAPGGDAVADFAARIDAHVAGLPDGRHLFVTHGGVIRYLLRREDQDRRVAPASWVDLEINRR